MLGQVTSRTQVLVRPRPCPFNLHPRLMLNVPTRRKFNLYVDAKTHTNNGDQNACYSAYIRPYL